jgi:protein phosphatase
MRRPHLRRRHPAPASETLTRDLFVVLSDAGPRRNNEDTCGFVVAPDGSSALMVLADGMGGHSSGEVASSIAIQTMLDAFRQERPTQGMERYLRLSVQEAHRRIRSAASGDPQHEGMGSTVVAALMCPPRVVIAHVGDSRAYQFRDGCVRRLTRDHLYVVETLSIPENRAKSHPQGHVLAQALGVEMDIRPDTATFDAAPGDMLLLCSDGVSECLTEPEMGAFLEALPLQEAVSKIIQTALQNGSRDNCTVVAVHVP